MYGKLERVGQIPLDTCFCSPVELKFLHFLMDGEKSEEEYYFVTRGN